MDRIDNLDQLGIIITNELSNNKLYNLSHIISKYDGNDWYDHIHIKDPYNRKIVYKNDSIEIIVITWSKNQSSRIHTHPENGCLMRILYGELIEEKYNRNLELLGRSIIKKDNISYIEGDVITHKIINSNQISVSLHIYSPPNYSAKYF